jgi:lipopolysaccharide export system protein LptA
VARAGALALLILPLLSPGAAERSPRGEKRSAGGFELKRQEPIHITSDRMEVDRKKNTVVYTGQVVAIQGDLKMQSRKLTATYSPDMKKLTEIVAEGEVRISQGDRLATGSRAVFNGVAQTITLTGNPVVRQGNNEVSGNRIVFFIEEDRAIAEGGSQRVRATIFPDELKRADQKDGGSKDAP